MRYIWITLMLLIGLTGCKGGGEQVDEGAGDLVQQPAEVNLQRLQVVENPAASVVRGTLSIEGFTLLEQPGVATQAGLESSVMVRLLDPEDDILVAARPEGAGLFELTYTGAVSNVKLEVEALVVEDLNGDGQGEDTLRQAFPLALRPGYAVQVDLVFVRSLNFGVDQQLAPDTGEVLLVQMNAVDALGLHQDYYGVFYASGMVVRDSDGNHYLSPADDVTSADLNRDGWPDSSEAVFAGGNAATEVLSGVIHLVQQTERTLVLRDTEGREVLVELDPYASIELYSSAAGFITTLPLDTQLIGRRAEAHGYYVGNLFHAMWLVIQEQQIALGPGASVL